MEARAFVVASCVVAATAGASSAPSPAPRPAVVELLDRYATHDFEAPVTLAGVSAGDGAKIADELDATGSNWTTAQGPQLAAGRRLIAATFALDVVRVWASRPLDGRWRASQRLLAWGCAELRKNARPIEGERWWHLAAVGLFESRQDVPSLIGTALPAPIPNTAVVDGARGHLQHALARFPGEPRFRLAEVVAREIATFRVGYWTTTTDARPRDGVLPPMITAEYVAALTGAARPIASPQDRRTKYTIDNATKELASMAVLRDLPRRFEALFQTDVIAGEAHLRAGYSLLRLGENTLGLDHLQRAEAMVTDPVLRYLARVFIGSTYERLDRPADAVAAYRRALEVAPNARTAGLALTSALMRESRVADAFDLAERLLAEPTATDPFSRYRTGDFRLVFDCLEQLKRVLP
jgi:tetratricopeptide (TPR) repeat protein